MEYRRVYYSLICHIFSQQPLTSNLYASESNSFLAQVLQRDADMIHRIVNAMEAVNFPCSNSMVKFFDLSISSNSDLSEFELSTIYFEVKNFDLKTKWYSSLVSWNLKSSSNLAILFLTCWFSALVV